MSSRRSAVTLDRKTTGYSACSPSLAEALCRCESRPRFLTAMECREHHDPPAWTVLRSVCCDLSGRLGCTFFTVTVM